MGKNKRVINKKKIEKKSNKRASDKQFSKSLLSILPLVALLIFCINIFIFYDFQSMAGVVFLYSLFLESGNYLIKSGKYIYYSSAIVLILLIYPLIKLPELDKRTKTFFYFYGSITAILLAGTPSEIYAKLFSGEFPWSIYFIVEIAYELAAVYIIYLAIKNYGQKRQSSN